MRLRLPALHRKTWYLLMLVSSLALLIVLGAELPASYHFDGMWKVTAFNAVLMIMLLVNASDKRREYRTQQLSKVRIIAYGFCFSTFWAAAFRQTELAGGVVGTGCSVAGVQSLYPPGVPYSAPYEISFFSSCRSNWAELVNYAGVKVGTKCCVELPTTPGVEMDCSSGLRLVPNLIQDVEMLQHASQSQYKSCCPSMMGNIVPPGFSTMGLSAIFGILGNVLFNAFKRTPMWKWWVRVVVRRVARSELIVATKAALVTVATRLRFRSSTEAESPRVRRKKRGKTTGEESTATADASGQDGAAPEDVSTSDDDDDGSVNVLQPPSLQPHTSFLKREATLCNAELTMQYTSAMEAHTCEYAFDRTVRSMVGSASISNSPCGKYVCVSALHDDGFRVVAVYDVQKFKESASAIVVHRFPDGLSIPGIVEVAVSCNGRWLACVHAGRRKWSLRLADDGKSLGSFALPLTESGQLSCIAFLEDESTTSEWEGGRTAVGSVVTAACGRSVVRWEVTSVLEPASSGGTTANLVSNLNNKSGRLRSGAQSPACERPVLMVVDEISSQYSEGSGSEEEDSAYNNAVDLYGCQVSIVQAQAACFHSSVGNVECLATKGLTFICCASDSDAMVVSGQFEEGSCKLQPPIKVCSTVDSVVQLTRAASRPTLTDGSLRSSGTFSPMASVANDSVLNADAVFAWRADDGSVGLITAKGSAPPETSVLHQATFGDWVCMALSTDGESIACGRASGTVAVFSKNFAFREYAHHSQSVTSLCFVDEKHLISSGADGMLIVVDIRNEKSEEDRKEMSLGVSYSQMILFPDGNRLACVSEHDEVHIQNLGLLLSRDDDVDQTGGEVAANTTSVPVAMSSPRDDDTVVMAITNSVDQLELRIANVSTGTSTAVLRAYLPCRSVYLNPAGDLLMCHRRDGSISAYMVHVNFHSRNILSALGVDRRIEHKRGPYCAMESASPKLCDGITADDIDRVLTVAIEKHAVHYRLHVFDTRIPASGDATVRRKQKSVVVNEPNIDLCEDLFLATGKHNKVSNIPLTAVALSEDATRICLWIGVNVFVCDINVQQRSVQVLSVLHPHSMLAEQRVFEKPIRLKATGGALQLDSSHGGRVLRIIEHDQHFFLEEWHNVYREREPGCAWLVETNAKVIKFRSHLESAKTAVSSPVHRKSNRHGGGLTPRTRPSVGFPQAEGLSLPNVDPLLGSSGGASETIAAPASNPGDSAVTVPKQGSVTLVDDEPSSQPPHTPIGSLHSTSSTRIERCDPWAIEVYGYPKSQDPMKQKIRSVMNVLFPLLRTDELSASSIAATMLPRGEGVITSAMCGTAYWPRDKATGPTGVNVTYEMSKFIVDMFQPSEFLVVKAVVASCLGLITAILQVAQFSDYPITNWNRFAMLCTSLNNGPIYSSIVDPVSALTVHLHLQRSGLFPIAGDAQTTMPHLYADRNSHHKAYLFAGGVVNTMVMCFWIPGFIAAGPFVGSVTFCCAILNGIVRMIIHSPVIAVSNATANSAWYRRVLAWLRHVCLFLLCLIDNVNINFFLQVVLRFPVNAGVVVYGGAPPPFFPYVKSTEIGPHLSSQLNMTVPEDVSKIVELPYMSMAGAAVAHIPFYTMQMSSGSCNAVKLTSTALDQLDKIFLLL